MDYQLPVSYAPKNLIVFPSNEYMYGSENILPYDNDIALKFMEKYGMQFPWGNLITKADGVSTCSGCGQTYAGCQDKCVRHVTKHRFVRASCSWGSQTTEIHTRGATGYRTNADYETRSLREELCDSYCLWSLTGSFESQRTFFKLIESMPAPDGTVAVSTLTDQGQISGQRLPVVLAQQFQILGLQNQLSQCIGEIARIRNAVGEIANKMNNAGHCLSF